MVGKSQYSLVEHLARIADPIDWGRVKLAMFTAYFDASGTEKSLVLAVGGFLATAEMWGEFEQQWLARLREDNLEYFHTTEFNSSQGQFKIGWRGNEKRRSDLIADLVKIIRDNVNGKYGSVVIADSLKALSKAQREQLHICSYSLAGRHAAGLVRRWASSWSGPDPEIVFEEGTRGRDLLEKRLARDGFTTYHFRPKKNRFDKSGRLVKAAIPLQAADLMAYELFDPTNKIQRDGHIKRIKRTLSELDKIPGELNLIRQPFMELLKAIADSPPSSVVLTPPGYDKK
ncbi:MAG: hypothetical protein HY316_06730 [Acidobacteria bacterium]|nr:hypothetical protein [Acidobacteriota bacterium]